MTCVDGGANGGAPIALNKTSAPHEGLFCGARGHCDHTRKHLWAPLLHLVSQRAHCVPTETRPRRIAQRRFPRLRSPAVLARGRPKRACHSTVRHGCNGSCRVPTCIHGRGAIRKSPSVQLAREAFDQRSAGRNRTQTCRRQLAKYSRGRWRVRSRAAARCFARRRLPCAHGTAASHAPGPSIFEHRRTGGRLYRGPCCLPCWVRSLSASSEGASSTCTRAPGRLARDSSS